MAFLSTIDNDTVASLPAARFAGRVVIVDKAEQISVELGKYSLEFKKIARRNMIFNIITLVIALLSFVGLMFLIFA